MLPPSTRYRSTLITKAVYPSETSTRLDGVTSQNTVIFSHCQENLLSHTTELNSPLQSPRLPLKGETVRGLPKKGGCTEE